MATSSDPSTPPGRGATTRTTSVPSVIRLHRTDNVAVARSGLAPGHVLKLDVHGAAIDVRDRIPPLHKVALCRITRGDVIRKYGQAIGVASVEIAPGSHVHSHNLVLGDPKRPHVAEAIERPFSPLPDGANRTFLGYPRPGGRSGTRNYLAVISSVNCSASVSRYVADRFRGPDFGRDHPHVDGVVAFVHKSGCAMSPGDPTRLLQRVLAGMARHPNITGYVLIGLGCEVNQTGSMVREEHLDRADDGAIPASILNIQALGGVQKTVDAGVSAVARLLPAADALRRTPQPVNRLVLALNCGGSDGASGITANPALGVASDLLVRHGGTSVLAETPEIYGAEHLLAGRATRPEVAGQLWERIRWWEDHVRRHGDSIDNNPSVGNKAGGLTTIYEKSLGAVAKGGQAPLVAVYQYAEPVIARGLCFMDTPGYDPVSMTGLVAGGCNIAAFTTGRGSVYGCKPTPCLKIATTSGLFEWMRDDMDINAGTILVGTESVDDVGNRIWERLISMASGDKTLSEQAGIGDEEFAPWILGPVL